MIFQSFLYGPNYSKLLAVNPHMAKFLAQMKELEAQITSRMNDPIDIYHTRLSTVDVEDYRANFEEYRREAILRAAGYAPIRLGKNEDGSIWVDTSDTFDAAEALEKMRATGGYKDIPWKKIETDLNMRALPGLETLDHVALIIDYYASEYAQYKTRIERQFAGGEQAEALAKLEGLFASAIRQAAENFVAYAGEWFERSGGTEEREAIYESFLDVYEQRKADYLAFIAENPDYAQVLGTEDEWLLYSGEFMGEMLRFSYISSQPEKTYTSQHGYSLDELAAIGFIVKETFYLWTHTNGAIRSDEEMGAILGIAAMKFALIGEQFQLRNEVKTKLEKAFSGFVEHEINKVQAELEWFRSDPYVRNKEPYAVDVNSVLILDIIRRLVAVLKANDMEDAFRNETLNIITSFRKKMLDETTGRLAFYHYSNSKWVTWLNQQFAENWNRFLRQLSAATNKNLDMYRLYTEFQWVDTKI